MRIDEDEDRTNATTTPTTKDEKEKRQRITLQEDMEVPAKLAGIWCITVMVRSLKQTTGQKLG